MDRINKFLNIRSFRKKHEAALGDKSITFSKGDMEKIRRYNRGECMDDSMDICRPFSVKFTSIEGEPLVKQKIKREVSHRIGKRSRNKREHSDDDWAVIPLEDVGPNKFLDFLIDSRRYGERLVHSMELYREYMRKLDAYFKMPPRRIKTLIIDKIGTVNHPSCLGKVYNVNASMLFSEFMLSVNEDSINLTDYASSIVFHKIDLNIVENATRIVLNGLPVELSGRFCSTSGCTLVEDSAENATNSNPKGPKLTVSNIKMYGGLLYVHISKAIWELNLLTGSASLIAFDDTKEFKIVKGNILKVSERTCAFANPSIRAKHLLGFNVRRAVLRREFDYNSEIAVSVNETSVEILNTNRKLYQRDKINGINVHKQRRLISVLMNKEIRIFGYEIEKKDKTFKVQLVGRIKGRFLNIMFHNFNPWLYAIRDDGSVVLFV